MKRFKKCVRGWHLVLLVIAGIATYLAIIAVSDFRITDETIMPLLLVSPASATRAHYPSSDSNDSIPVYGENEFCGRKYKTAVIMGLYNTGTNVLFQMLFDNCRGQKSPAFSFSDKDTFKRFEHGIKPTIAHFEKWLYKSSWDVTKHQPSVSLPYLDGLNVTQADRNTFMHDELQIVAIKDILTWIKSICKSPYYIDLLRKQWATHELCPYNLSEHRGTNSASQWHVTVFPSLVNLWNTYYESWTGSRLTLPQGNTKQNAGKWRALYQLARRKFDVAITERARVPMTRMYGLIADHFYNLQSLQYSHWNFTEQELQVVKQAVSMEVNSRAPAVVVRFEDILFRPREVTRRLCECVGGYFETDHFKPMQEAENKGHGYSRNHSEALRAYGDVNYRYENYARNDLQFIATHVNQTILKFFGYMFETARNRTILKPNERAPFRQGFYHTYSP